MGDNSDCIKKFGKTRWEYAWEAQSHIPTLRLLLFATDDFNPSLHFHNLTVQLHFSHSSLLLTTSSNPNSDSDDDNNTLLNFRVPLPKVLVDADSPLTFRALDDHVEVKLRLLLPVDHPILCGFDSVMNLSEEKLNASFLDANKPLVMESGNVKMLLLSCYLFVGFGVFYFVLFFELMQELV